MKPKTIFIIWILSNVIGLTGVGLFINASGTTKTISHLLMGMSLILSAIWFVG